MTIMDLNIVATVLGIIVNIGAICLVAVRVEHRLTKMETHIEYFMRHTEKRNANFNNS